MRKVCVVVGSRANYSSVKSVMQAVTARSDLNLQVVAGASALLDRYGSVVDIVKADGFQPSAEVHMLIEGETPVTMAKSTGLGLLELPTIFEYLRPDVVVTVGDRFETMSTAIAAVYTNIPLAHTMGGEVSGSVDESVRHAVTKLAHIHFPASEKAAERIIRMGEDPQYVFRVGCPRIDLAAQVARNGDRLLEKARTCVSKEGVGAAVSVDDSFLLVAQYPVTSEYGEGEKQINETLMALRELKMPAIMLWPNADAGSEDIARGIRKYREHHRDDSIRFYKNFAPEVFLYLMTRCACMVGNSSAAIREGAFLGLPAVNIGTRQTGRDRGRNIIDAGYDRKEIEEAITRQLQNGRFPSDAIYGDGHAGERIADILARLPLRIQKRISY